MLKDPVSFPVSGGGDPLFGTKNSVKGFFAIESADFRDIFDRLIRIGEQNSCPFQAQLKQITVRRCIQMFAEQQIQVRGTDLNTSGDLSDCDRRDIFILQQGHSFCQGQWQIRSAAYDR